MRPASGCRWSRCGRWSRTPAGDFRRGLFRGGGWVVLHQLQVGLSGWERRAAWMSVLVSFLVTVAVGGKLRKSLTYDDVFDGVLCSDAMIERGRRDVEADVTELLLLPTMGGVLRARAQGLKSSP